MNYNEEMAILFEELDLCYKLDRIKEKDKATVDDYIDIENKLRLREEDNKKFNSENKESTKCLSLSSDRRRKWKLKKQ